MPSTTVSSTFHKESYFVRSTPHGLNGAQYVAVSKDGSVLYGLRIRIEVRIIEQPELPPEVITEAVEKTICKYHVASGTSRTYQLDDDFDALQLTRILEFYTLTDDLVVILSYDPEHFQFNQTVVHLEKSKKWAQTVVEKRITVSRVAGPPLVNLSLLYKGIVLLCGARNTVEGKNERMTLSIASDPMSKVAEYEDLSQTMEDFNKFLTSRLPDSEGKQLISLFLLDIDENKISVLLSEATEDMQVEPIFATNLVGIIDRKTNTFSVEKVDNSAISTGEPLRITSIANMKVRSGSVWMSFSVNDVEKLKTFYWRMKHLYVRIMLRLMILGFHGSLYLWRFDNGYSFWCLTRFLMFLHGPTMIPVYSPQKKFYLCYLDMKRRKFYRYNHAARVLKSKRDPNDTDFAVNFDVDASGGALVVDYPIEDREDSQMALTYYPNPTKPRSLARLSMYSAYRNNPAFERSSLLRRLTGVIDWKWSVDR